MADSIIWIGKIHLFNGKDFRADNDYSSTTHLDRNTDGKFVFARNVRWSLPKNTLINFFLPNAQAVDTQPGGIQQVDVCCC